MATIASILDYDIPENSAQDSYDLLSVWKGKNKNRRKAVVVQSSANVLGLRWGKWKYIGAGNYKPQHSGAPAGELYDLSSDPSETVNVYLENPKVVEKMIKKLQNILEMNGNAAP